MLQPLEPDGILKTWSAPSKKARTINSVHELNYLLHGTDLVLNSRRYSKNILVNTGDSYP